LFKLYRLKDSITQFDKLLLIQPNHIASLNERGSVLAEMGKYDSALESIEKALGFQPQYAEAHLNKGNLHSLREHYDEAIASFDRSLAVKPNLIRPTRPPPAYKDTRMTAGSMRQNLQADRAGQSTSQQFCSLTIYNNACRTLKW
jgi:tetratricopeptide (TPR) repeat protein